MEVIDKILESLPRDGACRCMLEWIERTANDSTEELDNTQVTWSDQETGSSKDEALAKRAKHQGVTATLGRLPQSEKVSEGPTAAFGGPSNSETQSIVSGGADLLSADPFTPHKHHPGDQGGSRQTPLPRKNTISGIRSGKIRSRQTPLPPSRGSGGARSALSRPFYPA